MSVEAALVAVLRNAPGMSGVPVRPNVADDGDEGDYVVYTQYAGDRVQSLEGDSGLGNPRFQIDIYSSDSARADLLKRAVYDAVMGEPTLGAYSVDGSSGYEPETRLYRRRQDFSLWFND